MLILYAISVVSFCALVWAAFAITRHIRLASSNSSDTAPKSSTGATKQSRTAFAANPGNNSKQPQAH